MKFTMELMKKFWKPNNLYETLGPLHFITKIVGLVSFKQVKFENGVEKYVVSSLGICYSYTWTLLFVAYYVFAVEERNKISYVQENKVANTIEMYQLYAAVAVMTFCVFSNSFKQNILIRALDYLHLVDLKILRSGYSTIDYFKTRNYITVYVLFIVSIFASMEFMNCSMFLRGIGTLSTFCLLMCYIPLLVNGLVECQFITYILLLNQRFVYLNDQLKKLTKKCETNERILAEKLQFIRSVHWDLCYVGRSINKAFSIQLLFLIGNVFVSFTSLGYYSFDGFVRLNMNEDDANLYDCVTTTIWTVVKLLQILGTSIVCTVVRQEANVPKEILYKIKGRYKTETCEEVIFFGQQILHWNFRLTAFDFFNIDMTLFYSVVCSATTYLMILLQLDSANRQLERAN